MNLKKILLTITSLLITFISYAQEQNKYSISGKLIDYSTKEPIEYASIIIYKLPDTVLVTGSITNNKGEFTLKKILTGKYLLKYSFVGYQTALNNIEINNSSISLPYPLTLKTASNQLSEIQITENQIEKQISIEKTKINVSQNISSSFGSVSDILKSQSIVNIDHENNVYLRGNKNILILIDGVPTTISSLNSIPASTVESIEVISNPDAKYDAEGTGGIINIVSKTTNKSGFSGASSINYGLNNRINGGLSFNYSKGIWNIGFNYNGRFEKSDVKSSLERKINSSGIGIEQDIKSIQTNRNQTAGLLLSVKPSKKEIISLNTKLIFPEFYNIQNINGRQTNDTLQDIIFNRKNDITFARKVFEAKLSYKNIFEKNKNELSIDASFSKTKGNRPATYYVDNILIQESTGGGSPTNAIFQIDYLKSVFNSGRIECGLKGFSRWNNFNYSFYDLDTISNKMELNSLYSNDLEHQEYIYSTYLMYSDSIFKKVFYKIGGRLEYNTSELIQKSNNEKINKEYIFPFPFLLLKYNLDKNQNLSLSLNRRITRPTYPQINPFINMIDQMTYETGNKKLEPEILDKLEINYSFIKEKIQLRTNLYFSTIQDYITQISILDNNKLLITYINGNRQNKIGCDLDISYTFNKYLSINPSLSLFKTNSSGQYNGVDLHTNNFAWTSNIKTIIKPEKQTEIQVLFNYNSPISLPQFDLSNIYYVDIALKRAFLKNKFSASITLTDVFNTYSWKINSDNNVYRLYNYNKGVTRVLWIGLTYNFNSFKATKMQDNKDNDSGIIKLGQ